MENDNEKYEKLLRAIDMLFVVVRVKLEKTQSINSRNILRDVKNHYDRIIPILERNYPNKLIEFNEYMVMKLEQLIAKCDGEHDTIVGRESRNFLNYIRND
jgi:uncharacterized phage-like protein YoqJ